MMTTPRSARTRKVASRDKTGSISRPVCHGKKGTQKPLAFPPIQWREKDAEEHRDTPANDPREKERAKRASKTGWKDL